MLDTFFTQIRVRSRMESGPIGPYLSEIAAVLHRNGYAGSTIRRHLRAADRFGAWILKEGMSIVDINASTVDRYLEGLGRQFFPSRLGGTLPDKASGLRQMVEMLSQQGVLQPDPEQQPLIGIARCQTQNYLRMIQRYLRMVENFAMLHHSLLQRASPENHCVLTQLRWPLRSNCCPAVGYHPLAVEVAGS